MIKKKKLEVEVKNDILDKEKELLTDWKLY
jgi:hypothetical protein